MEPTSIASNTASETVTVTTDTSASAVHLVLRSQKPRRSVKWTEDVVDNEHMNKKKSNKCCLYQKPRQFGESDSEDECDSDLEHCHHGHDHDQEHNHGPTD